MEARGEGIEIFIVFKTKSKHLSSDHVAQIHSID